MWHFLPTGGEGALMHQKFLQVTPAKENKVLQEHPQHSQGETHISYLPSLGSAREG